MFVTFEVLNEDKSKDMRLEQLLNIKIIFTTFDVSNPDTSIFLRLVLL